jgi:hypothetical protein
MTASRMAAPGQRSLTETIELGLRQLIMPGQVTELRALHCSTASYRRPHTESGYFDFEHLAEMAQGAASLSGKATGVYFTLNPVDPDLLSRRCNRIAEAQSGELTSDQHITRRQWLLIDADPVRVSGVSAADSEKNMALDIARKIKNFLREENVWPDPVCADSGNGYHLLYRIDLPANDGGLVERCLTSLAKRFDTEKVKIDQSVFNASRICKVYGTLSRKGDSTELRPHRPSRILEDL